MVTILIVDDNEKLRSIFRFILEEYETIEARNGIEAIELYRKYSPDIVLMDILMPEMDGIEATKEILKINPKAKIAAITAYSSKTNEILDAGAKEVLKKPIRKNILIEKMKEYAVNM